MKNNAERAWRSIIWVLGALCLFSGCGPGFLQAPEEPDALTRLTPGRYPEFSDTLDLKGLARSVDNSLSYFKRVPLNRTYTYGKASYTAAHMIVSLETFQNFIETEPSKKALDRFIRSRYLVYRAAGKQDHQVLFTGYYEPTYEGRAEKSGPFSVPLFSRPDDMLEIDLSGFGDQYKGHRSLMARVNPEKKAVLPYYTREQINRIRDFSLRAEPVVWLKSRVDRFFLEVQGSGRIILDSGRVMRVHYAGSNGGAYRSIGRYLIRENEIPKEDMSMQAIREWLQANPQRMDEVLHHNESFVFFREESGGPFGSLGVMVTPFRSIATDSRMFPKGGLCFADTQLPDRVNGAIAPAWKPASFFVLNQDTGGAIKGPARADIFCGNDGYAEYTAGHMNVYGRLYFLVLKPDQGRG